MLCFLPGHNVVQEESGGLRQATGVGAYKLLPKFSATCFRGAHRCCLRGSAHRVSNLGRLGLDDAGAGCGLIQLTRTLSRVCIAHR